MRAVEIRGRLEQRVLISSVLATMAISGFALLFGILTGSFSILFDGFYALIDAAMAAVGLKVAQLILRDVLQRDEGLPGRVRYQYGFWHLEPLVLLLNSTLLTLATGYALISAVMLLFEGGTDPSFEWAIVYAAIVVAICFGMAWRQRRINRRLESGFVALDAKSWLMSGLITLALLVGFAIGLALQGTRLAWLQPYVDPWILALICLVVLPLPFSDLRAALAGVLQAAPTDLHDHVTAVARAANARHGMLEAYTYAARVGRATLIEIHFLTPPGWPITSIAALDAIRQEVSDGLGDEGPNRWLTISFTEDADWAF